MQRLGREHMLDLAGADAERERAERAMRRGMAVAADHRGARQGEALLGPDDVDDALLGRDRVDIGDAELGDVGRQRGQLPGAGRIGDRQALAGMRRPAPSSAGYGRGPRA